MLKKAIKKGFTIVELAIVIAVIAILVAVIVPTVVTVVGNAKISSDTTLVKNLNTALAIEEAKDGKNVTMSDALADVSEYGYDVIKLTPTSTGNSIVWDSTNDRFALVKTGEVPEGTSSAKVDLWKIANNYNEGEEYSVYLKDGYTGETALTVTTGIDVGNNENITAITYDRSEATTAQEVTIRTNGGTLTVNAPLDTVKHYNAADKVEITAVAGNSYHEYGGVSLINIEKGRLVIESEGEVNTINASEATEAVQIEAVKAENISTVVVGENDNITVDAKLVDKKVEKTVVSTQVELQAALDQAKAYVALSNDIKIEYPVVVTADTVIDGANYSLNSYCTAGTTVVVTTHGEYDAARGICIDANNITVSIINLTVDVRTNVTGTTKNPRGIQVNEEMKGVRLFIDNCDIKAVYYGINIQDDVEVDLTITNTSITAWGALNLWAANYQVKVLNCTLNGVNDKPYNADGWNDFATVVLEGDTTEKTNLHASVIDVQIINSTITGTTTTGNNQALLGFNYGSVGNVVTLTNCKFVKNDENTYDYFDDGENNKLIIDGEIIKIHNQ